MNGSEVFTRLQQTARELTSEKQRQASDAAELETHVSQLVQQRGETLLELAKLFLPALERSTVEATFAGIRQELLDVLAKRDAQQRERAAASQRIEGQLAQSQTQLAAVTETLNGLVKQREALKPLVAAQLAQHPKFPQLSKLAEQARVALKRNQARVAELQQAAKEKLPAYERSELFKYLYRRHFATAQYASTGWTRSLDRWVAGLIDYPQARRGYDFLRRSPEVLSKELEHRQQDFDALLAEMQAIEGEIAKGAGLTDLRERGTECGRQRDALVAEIKQRQDELHSVQAELQQLASGQNKFYQEALSRMQRFLGDTKTSVLEARARQTPEPQDDQLVAAIAALTSELELAKPHIDELHKQQRATTQRLQGIEQLVSQYHQQNYDSTRSYFEPPFEFDDLLERFADGEASSDELWRTIASRQRFRPTATSQIGAVAVDAMNNRQLIDAALQVTAAVIDAAARSSYSSPRQFPTYPSQAPSHRHESPGGFFGGGPARHESSGGGPWSGGDGSSGGSISAGDMGGGNSSGGGSSAGGDPGGSFTSGEGF